MSKPTVLVVEDERKLLHTLNDFLTINGYRIIQAEDGEQAIEKFKEFMHTIDIILLDIMLPKKNGYEVLKEIRRISTVPVIMLTAKAAVEDQLEGFESGADDYITKPYTLSIIKVHIEAILKRAGKLKETMEYGDIRLELKSQKVFFKNEYIETTPKEFELLQYFMENQGIVLNRNRILDAVWGYYYVGDIRTVDTLVKQLRKKIKNCNCIRSVYGVGYVFGGEEVEKD